MFNMFKNKFEKAIINKNSDFLFDNKKEFLNYMIENIKNDKLFTSFSKRFLLNSYGISDFEDVHDIFFVKDLYKNKEFYELQTSRLIGVGYSSKPIDSFSNKEEYYSYIRDFAVEVYSSNENVYKDLFLEATYKMQQDPIHFTKVINTVSEMINYNFLQRIKESNYFLESGMVEYNNLSYLLEKKIINY